MTLWSKHCAAAVGLCVLLGRAAEGQDTSRVMPQEAVDFSWIMNIPEFQDNVRFGTIEGYVGPYVRVVSLPSSPPLTLGDYDTWRLVGLVLVDTWTDPVTRDYAVGGATALGDVGRARRVPNLPGYTNLGITNVWNCVFLKHTGREQLSGWRAIIGPYLSRRGEAPTCRPQNDTTPRGTLLQVLVETPSRSAGDYPDVARILQLALGSYGLGFRCAVGWCNILPRGTTTVPAPFHAGASGITATPQSLIRGWFDDQDLSAPYAGKGYSSALSPMLRASIIPDRSLGTTTLATFRTSKVHVATIYLPYGGIPARYSKWGFEQGNNEIYITMSDAVAGTGYLQTPSGKRIPLTVHRHSHKEDVPPNQMMWETARWVYIDDDDAVWVGCDVGCCYIEPYII